VHTDAEVLEQLRGMLERDRGDRTGLTIRLAVPGEFTANLKPAPRWRVSASPRLLDGLKSVLGPDAVQVIYT
jgi:hypothetical protein